MKSGKWNNAYIEINGQGSAEKPIIIKAEQAGEVILTGKSYLLVEGSYITVDGLKFTEGYLEKGSVIQLDGHNNRLTNSAIIRYNPPKKTTGYHWLTLKGRDHRVDHNYFSGQNHEGVTTVVRLDGEKSPGHHRIDSNYYGQRPKATGNGFETIRIGTGEYSKVDAHVTVENNLFEEVDGELEIISNKSNDNIYQHNTFLRSSGTLTLRQGKRCIVDGNFFIGKNKKGTSGIRVVGEDHFIINNYIEGTRGRSGGTISLAAGTEKFNHKKHTAYPQVRNIIIAFNTLVNNSGPAIELSDKFNAKKRKWLPENIDIANNIFYTTAPNKALISGQPNKGINWVNNVVFGYQVNMLTENEFTTFDPDFKQENDLLRPQNRKEEQVETAEKFTRVITDMDGQTRKSNKEIGADQLSSAAIIYRPLTKADVGPSWKTE
jgi:poly(beta-D-mannuronate) lyase